MSPGGSTRKISKSEFKKMCSRLRTRGLSKDDTDDIESAFRGDLEESDHAITRQEAKKGIRWFRGHKSKHHLSPKQINILEEELRKRL